MMLRICHHFASIQALWGGPAVELEASYREQTSIQDVIGGFPLSASPYSLFCHPCTLTIRYTTVLGHGNGTYRRGICKKCRDRISDDFSFCSFLYHLISPFICIFLFKPVPPQWAVSTIIVFAPRCCTVPAGGLKKKNLATALMIGRERRYDETRRFLITIVRTAGSLLFSIAWHFTQYFTIHRHSVGGNAGLSPKSC
ncbi:hypothetical protein F5Y05DRAFT_331654 [Hypoxylon sp. FL0543]|nr:hypothetical protein F5Y05DRAFT_331654 [Hypoxylon sp. FL0543]